MTNREKKSKNTERPHKQEVFTLNVATFEENGKDGLELPENETTEKKTNYWETLMHIHKSNTGSGIFAMGDAFKNAGLLLGTVLVFVIGYICVYCQHLMLNVCDETAKRMKRKEPLGFEETAELCFEHGYPKTRSWAPHMGRAVRTFVCITQSGFCCVYIVFISTNLKQIWDFYLPDVELNVMMAIVILPMILLAWIRDLKSLAPLSTFANLVITVGVVIIITVACLDLPDVSERRLANSYTTLPLFFGTVVYTFEGIGLVTPIKKKSKNPDKFGSAFGPLNVGMTTLAVFMTTLGFFGYWRWGDNVKGSLTLNLDEDSILGQVLKILTSIGVMFTYPLQLSPAISNTFPYIEKWFGPFKRPLFIEILFRTLFTLFLFALAELVPHLALFISLVGAVSSTAIALVIPPMMDLATFHEDYGRYNWRIIRNVLIMIFGFLGFATGTYYGLKDIIETFTVR